MLFAWLACRIFTVIAESRSRAGCKLGDQLFVPDDPVLHGSQLVFA